MCGIAGFVCGRGVDGAWEPWLQSMTAALEHRGPDGRGHATGTSGDWRVALGSTRLAILDRSAAASQPMHDPATGCVLVYNGEIYNFVHLREKLAADGVTFTSTGDTEVLLRAYVHWGADFAARLRGMFACAIYDPRRRQLVLARDQLGIKPLYLARTIDGRLAFASEIRALLTLPWIRRALDPVGLMGYLAYGSLQDPYTLVSGVRALPAGRTLTVDLGGDELPDGRVERYWRMSRPAAHEGMTDAPGLVQRVLTDSVRHHLVSDVPIGVFLSGGIDSSSVAALVAENAPAGVHALTVSFEEAGFDESEVARDVAAHYGMKFTEVRITGADFLRDVPAWLTAQDMPSADGANSWIVSRACHDAGLTVALSGLGGDELFAGYYTFQATARARQLLRAAAWLPAAVRARAAAAVRVLGGRRTPTAKFADLLSTDGSLVSTYLIGRRMLWPTAIAPLVHPSVAALASPAALHPETLEDLRALSSDDDPTASVSVFEMSTYLLNTLLRDSDQMGMAHSVEIRVPFVDVDVVEQVSMLPGAVRTRGTGPKPLLCGAMGPRLKPAWTQRPKMTFSLPFDEWLRGPLRGEVGRGLARLAGFPFRADGVRRLWEAFLHGRGVNAPRILTLYSLSSWMERHRVDGGP